MRIFRLLRRLLLCLIVGVTSFGVSGWLLRPQPTWTVPLDSGRQFIDEPADLAAGQDPFWMSGDDENSLIAIDAATGRKLCTVAPPEGFRVRHGQRLPNGGLALAASMTADKGIDSWIAVFDATSDLPRVEHRIDGRAEIVADGRFYTIRPDGDGFVFRLAELVSAATVYERRFLLQHGRDRVPHYDVSADGSLLAYATVMKGPKKETPAVELWDIPRGVLVRRFTALDGDPSEASISQVSFHDEDRFLDVGFISPRPRHQSRDAAEGGAFHRQSFDLQRREIVSQEEREWKPNPPPGLETWRLVERGRGGRAGDTIYLAIPHQGPLSFAVYRDREIRLPWCRVPVEQVAMDFINLVGNSAPDSAAHVTALPNDQFLVQLWAPPYGDSLPKSLRPHLPDSFQMPAQRLFWHDWRRNDWRDVGFSGTIIDRLVRRDRVITLSRPRHSENDPPLLQSWPLPPRDPKWPAAGIGLLSSAAVWVFCARRAARRQKALAAE